MADELETQDEKDVSNSNGVNSNNKKEPYTIDEMRFQTPTE